MGIFFWKKNSEIDAFAHQLADELYSDIQPDVAKQFVFQTPPESSKDKNPKKSSSLHGKVTRRLSDIITKIQQYRAVHKLGIYGKARLHLSFTERLENLGYDKETAKELNKIILLQTP